MSRLVNEPPESRVIRWESMVRTQMQAMGGVIKDRINFIRLNNAIEHRFRHMSELRMYPRDGISTEIPIDEEEYGVSTVRAEAWATRVLTDIFVNDEVNFDSMSLVAGQISTSAARQMDKICIDGVYDAALQVNDTETNNDVKGKERPSIQWTQSTAVTNGTQKWYGVHSGVKAGFNDTLQSLYGIDSTLANKHTERVKSNPTRSGIFNPAMNTVPLFYAGKNYAADDTTAGSPDNISSSSTDDEKAKARKSGYLNYEKLLRLSTMMDNQNIPPGERYLFVSPEQCEQLLHETKVQSADFNTVRALVNGEVNSYCGFRFIKLPPRKEDSLRFRTVKNPFTTEANNNLVGLSGKGAADNAAKTFEVVDCICWTPMAVGGVMKNDFAHDIKWLPERLSHQIVAWFKMGSHAVDLRGIFMVPTRAHYDG